MPLWTEHAGAFVSVIIPCYNQGRFLADGIDSVFSQTHRDFEVVVVDDGSVDNTAEVAAHYPDVHYVWQANSGVASARNAGFRRSRGDYLVFLDADDRLLPDALKIGIAELGAGASCAFVWGHCHHIRFDGTRLPTSAPIIREDHYAELLRDCYVWMPGVAMFRRAAFSQAGGFNSVLNSSADHDLYLRLAKDHPVRRHGRAVAEYRRHAGNMTRDLAANLADRISLLRSQRRTVRRRGWFYRAAYLQGLTAARRYYGDKLVTEVLSDVWCRQWRHACRGFTALLAYHPPGAASVVRQLVSASIRHEFNRTRSLLSALEHRRDPHKGL